MHALWIRKSGGPEVLEVRETPDPEPKAGEVRIAVKAAGLNFAEISARQGIYPAAPKPPCVVGYEGAGIIDRLGEGVSTFELGTRVLFLSKFGAHASHVCVPVHQIARIPDALDFQSAAAIPVNYLTAQQMLFRVRRISSGDRILIHAAAGGVGTAVLQLAKSVDNVEIFGTASAAKHDYVRAQGCDHPIDYHSVDYQEEIMRLTNGKGLDLVMDALGGADWKKGYSLLRPGGMLIAFGLANAQRGKRRNWFRLGYEVMQIPRYNPLSMMGENRSVAGVDLGNLWDEHELIQDGLQTLVRQFEEDIIRPQIHGTFRFSEAAQAHEEIESKRNRGKVILLPDNV